MALWRKPPCCSCGGSSGSRHKVRNDDKEGRRGCFRPVADNGPSDEDSLMTEQRRSLCTPIPAIFQAANLLLEALEKHRSEDYRGATECLIRANDTEVWAYTDKAWGKGAAARYGFREVANSPPRLSLKERPKPRMPDAATRRAAIARDGYHCRFCGIPVIHSALRQLFNKAYPNAVSWGSTNASQHAAFQCMWLQFDHVLPNSRDGNSFLENIVVTCPACNFGRMEATLQEAGLLNPLLLDPPVVWDRHAEWDGLEQFRSLV